MVLLDRCSGETRVPVEAARRGSRGLRRLRKNREPAAPLGFQRLEPRLAMATVDMIFVPVANAGNAADPATGYGRVGQPFRIGKYEVTLGEYAAFLNAVAREDDPHAVYDPQLGTNLTSAGIVRSGSAGSYTYAVTGPSGIAPEGADDPANRPVSFVSWFDAARFANWMANGQPVGSQAAGTTENGAYDLTTSQALAGNPPARNATNPNTGAAPSFFLPTENQWYKAAYYDPALRGGRGGYWRFATRSNQEPGNQIGSGPNLVNYIAADGRMTVTQEPLITSTQNYLTNAGAMSGSRSSYGTFDQSGNLWELLDTGGSSGGGAVLRGGAWTSFTTYLAAGYRLGVAATGAASNVGFRLAAAAAPVARVAFEMLPVGDAGNAPDTTGFGSVAYGFTIAKTGVTIGQYTAFLNAVAKSDPHRLYNPSLGTDRNVGGITRVGTPGSYSYSVLNIDGNTADRPITFVSWFDAARFANWMANGQPQGSQNPRTTENGSYNLASAPGGRAVPRNAVNPNTRRPPTYFLPTENEWYKAAYYDPAKGGTGSPGYWTYATQSDTTPPTNQPPASAPPGNANYLVGPIYCVTQSSVFEPGRNYLTAVDAFADSGSHYGTLNQNGNVYQWNDLGGKAGLLRGLRGGFWAGGAVTLQKSTFTQVTAGREANDAGFRLVGPPVVSADRSASAEPDQAAVLAVFATWAGDVPSGRKPRR